MSGSRPHLVWVVADDLGTHDVPFTGTGSEVITPTLSRLAGAGLVLDSYYVQPLCTPTRAAFMTGRHPVSLGLQHGVIRDAVPDAVPINETMLPELLRAAGYVRAAAPPFIARVSCVHPAVGGSSRGRSAHTCLASGAWSWIGRAQPHVVA
jgi:arylsulfatase A-like enzyme